MNIYPRKPPTHFQVSGLSTAFQTLPEQLSPRWRDLTTEALRVLCVLHLLPKWHRDFLALLAAAKEKPTNLPPEIAALGQVLGARRPSPVKYSSQEENWQLTEFGTEMVGRLGDPEMVFRTWMHILMGPLTSEEVSLMLHLYPLPKVILHLDEAFSEEPPLYPSDCESCQYLGPFTDDPEVRKDIWYCPDCDSGTLILRHGEGGEYRSYPSFLWTDTIPYQPYLSEGVRRLRARNLLPKSYV